MTECRHIALLPGVSGAGSFWRPVADRLPDALSLSVWDWPGAGEQPADPRIRSYDDLVEHVAAACPDGSDIVAQSMSGIIALAIAIRHPPKVRRLVLVATSGGIDLSGTGVVDWREEYRATFPDADAWVTGRGPALTSGLARVTAPTLLIWGTDDPISPLGVAERLQTALPDCRRETIAGGTHSLAHDRPDEVAALIREHLGLQRPDSHD